MTQMVLELLSHRTPPSCVGANILTVANIICPNFEVVEEVPAVSFVQHCRSVLSYMTKLLAAYQLALAECFLEHHSDGTQRRHISLNNSIVRIAIEGGFKCVTLNSAILSEDETSQVLTQAIVRTFREGRAMLQTWRVVTQRVYPGRADLLALLPKPSDLSLSKLTNGGWIMTDTCNPAREFRKLFMAAITEIAEEEGMTKNEITIYEAGKSYQYMHVCIHYYTNINVLNLYFLIFTTRLLASSPQCLGWRSD